MSAGIAVYNILKNNTSVNAVLGGRIYPNIISQDVELVNAAYQVVQTGIEFDHDGPVNMVQQRLQIVIQAKQYDDLIEAAKAVRTALNGFRGTAGSVNVQLIEYLNGFDSDLNNKEIFVRRQDYRVQYKE